LLSRFCRLADILLLSGLGINQGFYDSGAILKFEAGSGTEAATFGVGAVICFYLFLALEISSRAVSCRRV
jgi:hypothetical protein